MEPLELVTRVVVLTDLARSCMSCTAVSWGIRPGLVVRILCGRVIVAVFQLNKETTVNGELGDTDNPTYIINEKIYNEKVYEDISMFVVVSHNG